MITSIFIKNFKAYEDRTLRIYDHNVIIGENDSGKTSILEALDIFFNDVKINKSFVRNDGSDVEIGIFITNDRFPKGVWLKKVYSPASYKEKIDQRVGNFEAIEGIRYIYLKAWNNDPLKVVVDLSTAKALSNTPEELLNQLKNISQNAVEEVINSIDTDLIVINNNNETNIIGEQSYKYDAGVKFEVKSDNIPIEARGMGFQKNLVYALLTGSDYENVVLGIDEVENSISVNNTCHLLQKVQEKFKQTIITTHSKKIVEVKNLAEIIPIFNEEVSVLSELLNSLDNTDLKPYLLLEGKYDLPWYSAVLTLLNKRNEYIIIPSGGDGNIRTLKEALEAEGKTCFYIKDGDTNEEFSLTKDCIELYVPLDNLNRIFELELGEMPTNKEDFFAATIVEGAMNEDTVKDKLSRHASEFITLENDLVTEVKQFLGL